MKHVVFFPVVHLASFSSFIGRKKLSSMPSGGGGAATPAAAAAAPKAADAEKRKSRHLFISLI